MASDWEGVSVSPGGSLLDPDPDWTRLDSGVSGLRCSQIQIDRGRDSEFEDTDTGTCEVDFRDRYGALDSTAVASLVSAPLAIAIRNPVTDTWWPQFRGHIERNASTLPRSKVKLDTTLTAVDAFDYFSNVQLIPGLAGFANAQVNRSGNVFYEDAGFDERILAILGDILWPVELSSVFTGNVICAESIYSSTDSAFQALQEAVDAEYPDMANQYVDPRGHYQAHGRYARFDPESVAASASDWDFNSWIVGDDAACNADPENVVRLFEPFSFAESRTEIRNAALAYPQDTDKSDLADFVVVDSSSRTAHGTRTWLAENLKVAEETTIGLTAKEWCQYIAQSVVDNYAQPTPRLDTITVRTQRPHGKYGPAAWDFLCRADISDRVTVRTTHPGGGGFSSVEFFIEGISMTIRPHRYDLDTGWPIVDKVCKLSPAAHYGTKTFGILPT